MAMLSLTEAARHAGTSRSSIFRAIRSGRLSASRTEHGEFRIDPAELARAYPPATHSRNRPAEHQETAGEPDLKSRNAALETEVRMLREKGDLMREMLNRLETDRDAWKSQAERLAIAGPQAMRRWLPWRRSN
jgi:hypothetical protein